MVVPTAFCEGFQWVGACSHLMLKEQGQEVAHTEEKYGKNKNQLDESGGKIFLKSGTTVHAQETTNTKKGAQQPIRCDQKSCVSVCATSVRLHQGVGKSIQHWRCHQAGLQHLCDSNGWLEGELLGMNRLEWENCRVPTTMLRGSYLPPFRNFPRNNRQMLTLDPRSVNYLFVTYSQCKPF
jgi:hypothetical protein